MGTVTVKVIVPEVVSLPLLLLPAVSADPGVVAEFTRAYVRGMHAAGMGATLKHFPGHGSVLEDTHFDDAVDPRTLDELRNEDLVPFAAGIDAGADAILVHGFSRARRVRLQSPSSPGRLRQAVGSRAQAR